MNKYQRGNRNKWKHLFSSKDETWRTPDYIYKYFNKKYKFNFDAAASPYNARTRSYLTKQENALECDWSSTRTERRIWLNPPYSRNMFPWFQKSFEESQKDNVELVAVLCFSRTDTKWFQEIVIPFAHTIHFITPRVKFLDSKTGKTKGSSTAPSCLIVFKKHSYNLKHSNRISDKRNGISGLPIFPIIYGDEIRDKK